MYAFLLPRRVMRPRWRARSRSAAAFRFLTQPLVAGPIWILILYGWHFALAYEAALRNPFLHALQHQTFIVGSLLVWISVLEPNRRRVPGGLWKIAHIGGIAVRGDVPRRWRSSSSQPPALRGLLRRPRAEARPHADQDQPIAGGMMLGLDFVVMFAALIFFFLRSAEDADREQEPSEPAALRPRTLPDAPAGGPASG